MPTGYTSKIYNGEEMSGKDFIMNCAKGFGACITMRDEPAGTPIPEEFKPSTYHVEQLEQAKSQLKKYQLMSNEEIQNEIDKEYENKIKSNKKCIKEYTDMKNRYLNTLAEVIEWQPPTKDHMKLKEFAISQLKDSIEFDCDISYYQERIIKQSPNEWIQSRINNCLENIEYHSKAYDEEVKRVAERNKWIKDLRKSFDKDSTL